MQELAQDHKVQPRIAEGGKGAGAGHQVHDRFCFFTVEERQRAEPGIGVFTDRLFEEDPRRIALFAVRVAIELNAEHRQPGKRSLQREFAV